MALCTLSAGQSMANWGMAPMSEWPVSFVAMSRLQSSQWTGLLTPLAAQSTAGMAPVSDLLVPAAVVTCVSRCYLAFAASKLDTIVHTFGWSQRFHLDAALMSKLAIT